jgi:hypothetical protein
VRRENIEAVRTGRRRTPVEIIRAQAVKERDEAVRELAI